MRQPLGRQDAGMLDQSGQVAGQRLTIVPHPKAPARMQSFFGLCGQFCFGRGQGFGGMNQGFQQFREWNRARQAKQRLESGFNPGDECRWSFRLIRSIRACPMVRITLVLNISLKRRLKTCNPRCGSGSTQQQTL